MTEEEFKEAAHNMLMMQNTDGATLLMQRPQTGIWGGLYSLPEVQDLRDIEQETGWELNDTKQQVLPPLRHTFSHYHLDITPVKLHIGNREFVTDRDALWYNIHQPDNVGLAAPVKRLLEEHTGHKG